MRAGRIPWEDLVAMAEDESRSKWQDLNNRQGEWTRDAVIFVDVRNAGYRLSEVHGKIPGLKYQAAAQGVKRIATRRELEPACGRFIRAMITRLSKI